MFEGKVIAQHGFKDGDIYTAHRIEVYKIFKGAISEPYVEVITMGGWYGTEGMSMSHGQLR